MKIGSISLENAVKFKYIEATVTYQKYIYEDIVRSLNILSLNLLPKNPRIKIQGAVFLCGVGVKFSPRSDANFMYFCRRTAGVPSW
jgi:hypothetical protein